MQYSRDGHEATHACGADKRVARASSSIHGVYELNIRVKISRAVFSS